MNEVINKEDIINEFEDTLSEINNKYESIKNDIKNSNKNSNDWDKIDILYQDFKEIDKLIDNLNNYKKFKLNAYLYEISKLNRSLYYLQNDTCFFFNIPLLQLIVFVNTFYINCMNQFKMLLE